MALQMYILYTMQCGHVSRLPISASISYPMSCLVCRKKQFINGIQTREWHARCNRRKCPFSAWTGMSQDLAEQAANRHARNAPEHASSLLVVYEPNPAAVKQLEKLTENHML